MRLVLLLSVLGFLQLSCGPSYYTGEYLDYKHAALLGRCPTANIEQPREHALQALQSSLADVNWVIASVNREQYVVDARACEFDLGYAADYLKRTDPMCATVRFMIKENADIHAVIPEGSQVHNEVISDLKEWMFALERAHAELRCYSIEILQERVADKKIPSGTTN